MYDDVLLLDIGNTRLKWASLKGEDFIPGGEVLHSGQLEDELLTPVAHGMSPTYVLAASVAGDENELFLREWVQRHFQKEIEYVTALQRGHGVINGYLEPAQLGGDRWAAMIAARRGWQGNLCVIDAGTALTLDLLLADGQHLGGYILPGLGMMQQSLLEGTKIPISIDSVILAENSQAGNNTSSCIANGVLQAACGLIERTIMQFEQQYNDEIQCILTGGDGQRLLDSLNVSCELEPNLVLRGVGHIARDGLINK